MGTFLVGVIIGFGMSLLSEIIWMLRNRPHPQGRCARCGGDLD